MELDKTINELKGKTFTAEDLDIFVEKYGWVYTEFEENDIMTYQVSELGYDDYFGEFVGTDENGYIFNEY